MTPSYQLNNQHSLIFWPSRQCYDLSNNILYPTAVKKIHPKTLRVFCERLCGWLGDDESGYLIYTQRLNFILGTGWNWWLIYCVEKNIQFSIASLHTTRVLQSNCSCKWKYFHFKMFLLISSNNLLTSVMRLHLLQTKNYTRTSINEMVTVHPVPIS